MSVLGLSIGGAALIAGLALAEPVNLRIDALHWRQRARALPRRSAALAARVSAAAPLLKQQSRRAWLKPFISRVFARRTRARFARGFPDALAILIRALRAGLPVTAAIAEVGKADTGPVARAFGDVVEAMRLGTPVESALWATARRLGIADFDLLVITIGLQRETGGNLAASIAHLDDTLRQRRLLALKVKAMAAEARASALIIASMPFAMAALMAVVSPDYLTPLFTTALGKALIGAGFASLATGGLIISQLMRIEA